MRFPHHQKVFRGQVDAAPFVGVFFLLIIFLLLNPAFFFTTGVPIQLPVGENLPGTENATAVVAVDASGQYYFENQLCDEAGLKTRLGAAVARSLAPITLVVQADKDARVEVFVRLGLLARSLGIRELLSAVRPPLVPQPSAAPAPGSP